MLGISGDIAAMGIEDEITIVDGGRVIFGVARAFALRRWFIFSRKGEGARIRVFGLGSPLCFSRGFV